MSPSQYWQKFLAKRPELSPELSLDAWTFGGSPDELAALVLAGKKTATCSLLSVYQDGKFPVPGTYSVLLNSRGEPQCVIYLRETFVKKFNEIDEKHAWEEGEGDRTLKHWREMHLKFFSAYDGFTEESELLCERFEVVS